MFHLFLGIFFLYDGKLCVTKVACFVVQFSTISHGGPVVFYTTNQEDLPTYDVILFQGDMAIAAMRT